MSRGKYYLNWGLNTQRLAFLFFSSAVCLSLSLSLFLKGTCTFTAWAILCIAATVCIWRWICLIFLFLSGREPSCCAFYLDDIGLFSGLTDVF